MSHSYVTNTICTNTNFIIFKMLRSFLFYLLNVLKNERKVLRKINKINVIGILFKNDKI